MLQNKTALITGASRGIGRAIAQLYAKNGCHVAFTDLCLDENVVSLIQEIESPHFELDVTSLAECCGEEATESKAEETEKSAFF